MTTVTKTTSLEEMQREAIRAVDAAHGWARRAVDAAWEAGQALQAVKDASPHGTYGPWCRDNRIAESTQHRLRKLFSEYPDGPGEHKTVAGALKALAPPSPKEPEVAEPEVAEIEEEASAVEARQRKREEEEVQAAEEHWQEVFERERELEEKRDRREEREWAQVAELADPMREVFARVKANPDLLMPFVRREWKAILVDFLCDTGKAKHSRVFPDCIIPVGVKDADAFLVRINEALDDAEGSR